MFELAAVVIASLSVVIFLAHVSKPFEPNRGSIGIMAYDIIFQSRRDRDRLFGEEVKPAVIERRRPDTLYRALVAANDNGLTWPLVPMFDGFFGA